MNNDFAQRVRAAAVAGWWTLLLGLVFLTVGWFAYLALVSARPAWLIGLWGPDTTWLMVQTISLWFFGAMKFILWLMLLAATWLTLWARQLRAP